MSEAEDRRQLQDVMLSYAAAVDDRDMARYRALWMMQKSWDSERQLSRARCLDHREKPA